MKMLLSNAHLGSKFDLPGQDQNEAQSNLTFQRDQILQTNKSEQTINHILQRVHIYVQNI
jgi:hypothetical protein